jgi:tetratricopeptide (TPR) repeat protein
MRVIPKSDVRQGGLARKNGGGFGGSIVAIFFAIVCSVLNALSPQPGVTIQGVVSHPGGVPIGDVPVRLERAESPPAETRTSADGSFWFHGLQPGDYTLSAKDAGGRSAMTTVHVGQSELQRVDLVIGEANPAPSNATASTSPEEAMAFADKPNFTIAAVTDWTAAGGHGSDAVLRTSEALNREALNLRARTPDKWPATSTKEWKQEETALRAALANAPDKFGTNHELGMFYLMSERYRESVQPLENAYRINPQDFENEYELAQALKESGEVGEALDHVQKLKGRHDSAKVHRLAGELEEKRGDPLAAVHEFERAVREDPSEQNYFEWGSELLLHRAVWQAKEVFTTGIYVYPKSERILTALGAALFAGALYDEAARRLCEASDLDPGDTEPYMFLGKVEISSPNPLPCVEQKLERFAAERPEDPLASYFYAMTLWKQKGQAIDPPTLDRVQDLLAKAVRLDPKCSDAYLQLGVLEATRRDYQKAIEFYTKAIEVNPQMSEAHYRLGMAYDRVGDKTKATEQFRLHDEIERQQAAAIEKQRREVKQFVVVVDAAKSRTAPQ